MAGFDGRCLEATDNLGVPNLHLSHCNYQEPKQEWAFHMDGTMVWEEEYCLGIKTADPPEVMLMKCDMPGVAQWMISPEGMMVEGRTNLYLTASNFDSWSCSKISNGQANFGISRLSMAPCKDIDTQLWYYYPDNTLRPVPHLCITVEINQQLSPVISQCNGFGYNVWFFNGNGTISGAKIFASFMQANADLSISLGRPTSKWNQQWIVDSYLYVGLRGRNPPPPTSTLLLMAEINRRCTATLAIVPRGLESKILTTATTAAALLRSLPLFASRYCNSLPP
ncbi:hypothetical protein ACFX13_044953 [Malus domestica]